MKKLIVYLCIVCAISCAYEKSADPMPSASEILQKSVDEHDANARWTELEVSMRIQEPRLANPTRYSIVRLNQKTGAFELVRNRDEHESTHIIDDKGLPHVLFNDQEEFTEEQREKYRLDPKRSLGYKEFYELMYGLPMSLNENTMKEMGEVSTAMFNETECYVLPITLKKEMFSKYWRVFIAQQDFLIKGVEIYFPDDDTKGERLYFDGEIELQDVRIPRIRHWHELTNDEYSGSDIIVKELSN